MMLSILIYLWRSEVCSFLPFMSQMIKFRSFGLAANAISGRALLLAKVFSVHFPFVFFIIHSNLISEPLNLSRKSSHCNLTFTLITEPAWSTWPSETQFPEGSLAQIWQPITGATLRTIADWGIRPEAEVRTRWVDRKIFPPRPTETWVFCCLFQGYKSCHQTPLVIFPSQQPSDHNITW